MGINHENSADFAEQRDSFTYCFVFMMHKSLLLWLELCSAAVSGMPTHEGAVRCRWEDTLDCTDNICGTNKRTTSSACGSREMSRIVETENLYRWFSLYFWNQARNCNLLVELEKQLENVQNVQIVHIRRSMMKSQTIKVFSHSERRTPSSHSLFASRTTERRAPRMWWWIHAILSDVSSVYHDAFSLLHSAWHETAKRRTLRRRWQTENTLECTLLSLTMICFVSSHMTC